MTQERPRIPVRLKWFGLVLFCVFLIACSYALLVMARSYPFYQHVKGGPQGLTASLHTGSPELGYTGRPGSEGKQRMAPGWEVPLRYDESGFRVPLDRPPSSTRPSILGLGCSFTFGAGCLAEETYLHVLARGLGGRELNAAKCSYGLSQIVLQARDLIPRFHPDVVVVQYSSWLIDRAQSPFTESTYGKIPAPYFAPGAPGQPVIQPPFFTTRLFDLPLEKYRQSPAGIGDYLGFLTEVGGPLLLHEDRHMIGVLCGRASGRIPPVETDRVAIVRAAYGEIHRLCQENDAAMVVLLLWAKSNPAELAEVEKLPGVLVVDGDRPLVEHLPEKTTGAYGRAYGHWRGDPPALVDKHPNALAHRYLGEALLEALAPGSPKRSGGSQEVRSPATTTRSR